MILWLKNRSVSSYSVSTWWIRLILYATSLKMHSYPWIVEKFREIFTHTWGSIREKSSYPPSRRYKNNFRLFLRISFPTKQYCSRKNTGYTIIRIYDISRRFTQEIMRYSLTWETSYTEFLKKFQALSSVYHRILSITPLSLGLSISFKSDKLHLQQSLCVCFYIHSVE